MTGRRHGTGTFIPSSVEGFRYAYGRTPTPDELRACIDLAHPPRRKQLTNGCDCYDPECTICCDERGEARTDNLREV